ncbi:MAG: hypothetical protein A49_23650 [Methyloceanibacter sp.]|nr:MAG: hypothetical protein A49_23650 [Methyloceanibacter sp.]
MATRKRNTTPAAARCPLAGQIVLPVRVDHGEGIWKCFARLVVVEDDHLRPGAIGGLDGLAAGRAAIHGEDQPRALLHEPGQGFRRRAIAFGEAVGNVGQTRLSVRAQKTLYERHARCSVDVVIAEDPDRLAAHDRRCEPLGGAGHVLKARRVRHQGLQRRVEIAFGGLKLRAPCGQDTAQQFGQAVGLRYGRRDLGTARLQPLGPSVPARGPFDAEHGGMSLSQRVVPLVFRGGRHGGIR